MLHYFEYGQKIYNFEKDKTNLKCIMYRSCPNFARVGLGGRGSSSTKSAICGPLLVLRISPLDLQD